jgi:hypothetical protein|tara:strand:- start:881 stop:1108 length:228 start_codon:yes stop_codon:yes gene_type:complete
MREQLLRAALANFESQALTARANLEVYLTQPSGVGEHPNLVIEVVNLTQTLTEAEENVRTLEALLIEALVVENDA